MNIQATSKRQAPTTSTGLSPKQAILAAGRIVMVIVVMLVAIVISSAAIRTGVDMPADQASQAAGALLIVSLINSLVLAYLILRSRWSGINLMAAVFVVHFGVETFMSQIETLYFNNSIAMPLDTVIRVIGTGLVRALVFAPLAVLVLGKLRGAPVSGASPTLPVGEWVKRFAILAVLYAIVYFVFGYFVAWQWPEVRQYYTGSTTLLPFTTHILNTLSGDPILPLFQVVRGAMWAGLALLVVRMIDGNRALVCVAVGITLAVLLASGVVFPNPFMPSMVRQGHLYELSSSMLTFGVIAGWVWTRFSEQSVAIVAAARSARSERASS